MPNRVEELQKKKLGSCIQNWLVEQGKLFCFVRLYLDDIRAISEVTRVLSENNINIKYGTFCTIEQGTTKTKWSFYFTVDNLDVLNVVRTNISLVKGVSPITTFNDDIIFLAEGYGYCPDYPFLAYNNLEEDSNRVVIIGKLWSIMVEAISGLSKEGAAFQLYIVGQKQGERLAERLKGFAPSLPNSLLMIKHLFQGCGYCLMDFNLTDGVITKIKVSDSFFFNGDCKCDFLQGVFETFFTKLYKVDHKFTEEICKIDGIDYHIFSRTDGN